MFNSQHVFFVLWYIWMIYWFWFSLSIQARRHDLLYVHYWFILGWTFFPKSDFTTLSAFVFWDCFQIQWICLYLCYLIKLFEIQQLAHSLLNKECVKSLSDHVLFKQGQFSCQQTCTALEVVSCHWDCFFLLFFFSDSLILFLSLIFSNTASASEIVSVTTESISLAISSYWYDYYHRCYTQSFGPFNFRVLDYLYPLVQPVRFHIHSTLPIMKKKYAEILLCCRRLFIMGNVFKVNRVYLVQRFSFVIANFSLKATLL